MDRVELEGRTLLIDNPEGTTLTVGRVGSFFTADCKPNPDAGLMLETATLVLDPQGCVVAEIAVPHPDEEEGLTENGEI